MNAIKTTVYVCSSLMLGAAVFGAIDYNKASQQGKLKKLYKEEEPLVTNNLIIQAKKEVDFDDYSRGPIEEKAVATSTKKKVVEASSKKVAVAKPLKEEVLTDVVANEAKRDEYILKSKKKISFQSFSRAPLSKKNRVIVDEEVKKDTAIAVIEEKK